MCLAVDYTGKMKEVCPTIRERISVFLIFFLIFAIVQWETLETSAEGDTEVESLP